jgi:hypothetical protein
MYYPQHTHSSTSSNATACRLQAKNRAHKNGTATPVAHCRGTGSMMKHIHNTNHQSPITNHRGAPAHADLIPTTGTPYSSRPRNRTGKAQIDTPSADRRYASINKLQVIMVVLKSRQHKRATWHHNLLPGTIAFSRQHKHAARHHNLLPRQRHVHKRQQARRVVACDSPREFSTCARTHGAVSSGLGVAALQC